MLAQYISERHSDFHEIVSMEKDRYVYLMQQKHNPHIVCCYDILSFSAVMSSVFFIVLLGSFELLKKGHVCNIILL